MIHSNEISSAIKNADRVIISTHIQPDGDGIGSMIALYIALKDLGKEVHMVFDENVKIPSNVMFLPEIKSIKSSLDFAPNKGEFDLGIVLDAGNFDRIGSVMDFMKASAKVVLNLDHHVTNDNFGDLNWVSPEASATGEIVFQLISELSISITPEIATCLFTAISTDTGCFSYANTTATTLEIASKLVFAGANPASISREVYDTKSYNSLATLAECIMGIEFKCDGLAAFMFVTQEIMNRHKVEEADIDDFISYVRSIAGVEVAVTFRETADGKVRVGFRSKQHINVSQIALKFGGGGHPKASGCTLNLPFDEAVREIVESVKSAVVEAGLWTES